MSDELIVIDEDCPVIPAAIYPPKKFLPNVKTVVYDDEI